MFIISLGASLESKYNLFWELLTLDQAVTGEEGVDIPSPGIEGVMIVDSVHVLQTARDRVGQVDIQPFPPGEHPDGLQGKTTLEMFSI